MPSTYSTSLRLELIGNGEQAGNWGNTNNINLGTLLEQAIAGVESVAISGTSYTLTTGNGVSDQARNAVIVLTGTLSANCNVIVPSVDKTYTFRNATTGGFSVVVKTSAGSGVTIANGYTQAVYCDATNVVASGPAFNNATNSVAGNLVGSVSANSGSAAAPSITFTGDPDTGIYNAAPNEIGFSVGGNDRFIVNSNGAVLRAGIPILLLDKSPGENVFLRGASNTNIRWDIILGDSIAESGSNSGSNFAINRYNDAGSYIGTPITINRATGVVNVAGQLQNSAGTAVAPAYSFGPDADTGIFNTGPNALGVAMAGVRGVEFAPNIMVLDTFAGAASGAIFIRAGDASATNAREALLVALNESSIPVSDIRQVIATDGSSNIQLYATPAGSRASDRRVNRVTIPGSGAINMVGPVNVTSGALQVGGNPVQIQRDTEKATTSGTTVDFPAIPAGVRRITVMFDGVSTNGSSLPQIQIGSGSFVTSGYLGTGSSWLTTVGTTANSSGFLLTNSVGAGDALFGRATLTNISGNKWIFDFTGANTGTARGLSGAGSLALSGTLDRLRLTMVNGTDTFDAGAMNIMWEF